MLKAGSERGEEGVGFLRLRDGVVWRVVIVPLRDEEGVVAVIEQEIFVVDAVASFLCLIHSTVRLLDAAVAPRSSSHFLTLIHSESAVE